MTTSDIPVPGGTQNVPTYAFSEDSKTKDLERVALNESDGSDLALGAKLGALTETAPTTDTASSGLNGRLQRVAQRLTSLVNAVGTQAYGAGTASSAQRVTLASDDAAVAALGAKTDAKSTATDTTAVSGIALWKQISASAQALTAALGTLVYGAGTAASAQRVTLASDDPAVATLGATSGAKVITDANGTIQQYLRGLVTQWISSTLTLASRATSAGASFTCGTTAYAINDVVGAASASGVLQFSNMGPSGANIQVTGIKLEIDASALISGEGPYQIAFYNATMASAINDSSPFDLPSGDRSAFLDIVTIGTPVDLGSTLFVSLTNIAVPLKLSGTDLFAYLITNNAYTPTGRAFKITVSAVY